MPFLNTPRQAPSGSHVAALIGAVLVLAACSTVPTPPVITGTVTPQPVNTYSGRPFAVHDGDTFKLDAGDRGTITVRMAGIDAPELGQAFSKVSRDALKALLGPGPVTITCAKVDRYGRAVCNAEAARVPVNLEMVRRGLAWHYKRYELEQTDEERKAFAVAEESARQQRVGLWSFRDPMAPWECRQMKREHQGCR